MDIDVYLESLVDDLKIFWNESIKGYDAYRDEQFTMRGVLLWIINDFLTYDNLSRHVNVL